MTDRRTGSVGVTVDLNRTGITLNRQTGTVGATVDLNRTGITLNRQTGTVGVTVDLMVLPVYPLTGNATQAQAVALQTQYIPAVGNTYPITRTAQQSTTLALTRTASLTRRIAQPQLVGLVRGGTRVLAITQSTVVSVIRQYRLTRTTTQAQTATEAPPVKVVPRIVTATQATAVSLRKTSSILVRLTGNRRVSMTVTIAPALARTLRITKPTSVRLVKQVRLTRAVTVGQSVSRQGIPVQLRAVTAVQTRSLALGRAVSLTRSIAQSVTAYLGRNLGLEVLVRVPTVASVQRATTLTRSALQGTSVSVAAQNVTPRYDVLVSLTVSQSVSLSTAGVGAPSFGFEVVEREAAFTVSDRNGSFVVPGRRRTTFVVGSRQ